VRFKRAVTPPFGGLKLEGKIKGWEIKKASDRNQASKRKLGFEKAL